MWKEATHDSIEMVHVHHFVDIRDLCHYQNQLLLICSKGEVNQSYDMWINYFLSFNRTYIIQYEKKFYSNIREGSTHIPVLPPSGFINEKDETRCHLNSTLQIQYYNIIFREMILNIDCEYIFSHLDTDDHDIILNQQMILILEELQKLVGQLYIGGKMQKYFLSRVDGPSRRQNGDNDVGDTLVCIGIYCRQKAITSPEWLKFINLCDKTPGFLRQSTYQELDVIQRMTPRTNVSQQESYQSVLSRTICTILLMDMRFVPLTPLFQWDIAISIV